MKNLKIAMVGAGYIADYHTCGLQSISGVEVVAVVAKTVEEAQKFANKYEINNQVHEKGYCNLFRYEQVIRLNII